YHILDFSRWKTNAFETAFRRLLDDLKVLEPPVSSEAQAASEMTQRPTAHDPVRPTGTNAPDIRALNISREEMLDALMDAFPERSSLMEMLMFGLNIDLEKTLSPGPLPQVAFDVLRLAEAHGWSVSLIEAAYRARPGNRKIRLVYEKS